MSKLTSLNKNRVILTTIVIFMISAFILSSISIYTLTRENQIKRNLLVKSEQRLLDSGSKILSYRINRAIDDLLYLSNNYEIQMDDNRQNDEIASEWQTFAENIRMYDQIRFIDQNGNEKIRINFSQEGSVVVPDSQLQNKEDRYYFTETAKLEKGQIYLSKFDLNVENNQIEKPDKPMIRLATPLFDRNNEFRGIVILNYYGKALISLLDDFSVNSAGNILLLNSDGYWLYNNPDHSLEWSFMYDEKKDISFKNQFTNEWDAMRSAENGEFKTDQGYLIYKKIITTRNETTDTGHQIAPIIFGEGNWTLVSSISSQSELGYLINFSFEQYFDYIVVRQGGVFAVFLLASFAIALLYQISRQAKAEVRKSRDELLKFAAQVPGMLYQYEITPQGKVRIPFSTDAIKDIFGCTPDAVRDDIMPVMKVIDPEDVNRMNAAIAESVKNLSPFQIEYRVLLPGQPVHWILAHSMPEKREDGTVVFHGFNTDITGRKKAEDILIKERELFNTTLMSVGEGIVMAKLSGEILVLNDAVERITGYSKEEVLQKNINDIFQLINVQTGEHSLAYIVKTLQMGKQFDKVTDFSLIAKNGTQKRISTSISLIKATEGEDNRIIASFRDVDREYELEKQIQGFLDVNIDMLCVSDLDGNFHKINRKFETVLGYTTEDIVGKNFMSFIHPDDVQTTLDTLKDLDRKENVTGFVNRYRCKDGSYKYIEWNSIPGVGKYLYSSARDVTPQRQLEEQLRQAAIKDELTGLFNRHYFEPVINEQMQYSDRYDEPLSILLLDLDHFKQVNDTWGHPVGDELLKLTARTIGKAIRESDILVRFGGEEFVVLMPRTSIDGALLVAEKIRAAIENNPLATVGIRTASLGAAERMKAESFRHWYRRLDEALYKAKHTGRNRVVVSDGNERLSMTALDLEWRLELQSGNNEIDQQHQGLFDIGNRLINLSLDETKQAEIMKQLEILLSHTVSHFAYEEKILEQAGYPEVRHHAEIHKEIISKALRLKKSYEDGEIKASAFFSFVADDVILNHMMNEDTKFFPYLK